MQGVYRLRNRCFIVIVGVQGVQMTFLFAAQKYPFEIRYLGCVPLVQSQSETVATEAVELLNHKLESLQVSNITSPNARFLETKNVLTRLGCR